MDVATLRRDIEEKMMNADITRVLRRFASDGDLYAARRALAAMIQDAEQRGREEVG